jgi:hypothetical protein
MKTGKCWLAIATDNRAHAGNSGYDDVVENSYVWDSTVKYHNQVGIGDVLVFFDKVSLLGAAVIDDVVQRDTVKSRLHCPSCDSTQIKRRKSKLPPWKGNSTTCKHEFESPLTKMIDVVEYRSVHDRTYVDLTGLLSGPEVRALCNNPRAPDSFRPMDLVKFMDQVRTRSPLGGIRHLEGLLSEKVHGHTLAMTRVRIGQGEFRRKLLEQFGSTCAITGASPERALEACHLYSYAKEGKHHDDGGLLIRRDLHTLFDFGLLTVDPVTLKVATHNSLKAFPGYSALNGTKLKVEVSATHKNWLKKHKSYWDNGA